jgi:organic hydroperoxide reductase OsmC/OhrA
MEARGEVETEGTLLVIKRIHVTCYIKLRAEDRETAGRVHGFHRDHCPVACTIGGCVDITTSLETIDLTT